MNDFNPCLVQKVQSTRVLVRIAIDHADNAGLVNELAHSLHGERVMYKVAPSALLLLLASLVMALASACSIPMRGAVVSPRAFGKPFGVPL